MAPIMVKLVCTVVAAAMLVANVVVTPAAAAMSCPMVASYVHSCIGYVSNRGPLGGCCNGVRALYSAAKSRAERQNVCRCLKRYVANPSYNFGKAADLPRRCGLNIPYNITPTIDCAKVP